MDHQEVIDDTLLKSDPKYHLECSFCDAIFPCEYHRTKHMKEHIAKGQKPPYSCDVCLKDFFNAEKFRNHKCLIFNKSKCYICGDKEFRSVAFAKHLREFHKNDPNFDCKLCSKKCRFAKSLNHHIMV